MAETECWSWVQEQVGLDVCHGQNNTERLSNFTQSFKWSNGTNCSIPELVPNEICNPYEFPKWLDPLVKFLWFLFTCQIIMCCLWMYFFWTNINYRRSIFRFKHESIRKCNGSMELDHEGESNVDREIDVTDSPNTQQQKSKSFPLRLDPLTNNVMTHALSDGLRKGMFLPPTIDEGTFKSRYRFRDFWAKEIRPDEVEFGHKVFRLPTFRLQCLKRIDQSISPKVRIILSFMVIYSSLIALVCDFFIDVYFLQGLSTDTLIDVRFIHFEYGALLAMVCFEFSAFLCLPITAFVFYKMSWSHNIQTNLIGEVIIISLQYLMEDGPELILQYFFVDKYAGTNYVYPDGTTFSGRAIVVCSSLASLVVAIIGVANLAALYHEVQFWLTLRATRDYLKEETWDTYHVRRLPSVVWELKKQAAEDDLVERAKHDIKRIQKRCRQIALEHNQRAKKKKMRRPVKMKTFRTQLREIDSFREDRNDNQNLIDKIKASSNVTRKFNAVRVVMLIVGFIPFFVNLCRLGAAVYQIFIFRKYNTGCLRYVFDHQTNMTTISQPRLVDYECWEWVEYPFFILNFIGLVLHFTLLCCIGIGKLMHGRIHSEFIETEDSDSDESEDDDENDAGDRLAQRHYPSF